MPKYVTLYLQQNLARRHEPSGSLNRLLDELAPFSFISRSRDYLETRIESSAFPEILTILKTFVYDGSHLPRIIPIALIQEPNLSQGRATGFPGKLCLYKSNQARAAIIALPNTNISLIEDASSKDLTWAVLSYKGNRTSICSFYSDISSNNIDLSLTRVLTFSRTVLIAGDSNAHSTLWGNESNNPRGGHLGAIFNETFTHASKQGQCSDFFKPHW